MLFFEDESGCCIYVYMLYYIYIYIYSITYAEKSKAKFDDKPLKHRLCQLLTVETTAFMLSKIQIVEANV